MTAVGTNGTWRDVLRMFVLGGYSRLHLIARRCRLLTRKRHAEVLKTDSWVSECGVDLVYPRGDNRRRPGFRNDRFPVARDALRPKRRRQHCLSGDGRRADRPDFGPRLYLAHRIRA